LQRKREWRREVFYVFDCLSEFQTIWATDMMMSNFFRVTCPFLFEMDFVDPVKYYLLPYAEKPAVRDVIHRVNWRLRGKGVRMVLLVPGRIGTSSPELGVPTVFSDISEFDVVVEIASSRAGYNPELSYGSHFFQDLVEAGIGYTAVFEDAHTVSYHPERLLRLKDVTTDYLPEGRDRNTGAAAAVSVLDARGSGLCLYTDINSDVTLVVYSGEKA
jgi:hypothetical protein